jgi:hypothetical protein
MERETTACPVSPKLELEDTWTKSKPEKYLEHIKLNRVVDCI